MATASLKTEASKVLGFLLLNGGGYLFKGIYHHAFKGIYHGRKSSCHNQTYLCQEKLVSAITGFWHTYLSVIQPKVCSLKF